MERNSRVQRKHQRADVESRRQDIEARENNILMALCCEGVEIVFRSILILARFETGQSLRM